MSVHIGNDQDESQGHCLYDQTQTSSDTEIANIKVGRQWWQF